MNKWLLTKLPYKTALAGLAVGVVLITGCDAKQPASKSIDTTGNAQTDASNGANANAGDNAANGADISANNSTNNSSNAQNAEETATETAEPATFGIKIGEQEIHLRDKQNKEAIVALLGEPLKEENIEQSGDGFTGSTVKKLYYEGITFELFAPPADEGQEPNYWVLNITASAEQFKTTRNIAVGNTVEELLQAYPEAEVAKDGRVDESTDQLPTQYAYQIRNGIENELRFEIDNGRIAEIRLMYWIP